MKKTSLEIRLEKQLAGNLIQALVSNFSFVEKTLTYKNALNVLLVNPEYRSHIISMFLTLIRKHDIKFDYIIGKSVSGIAYATTVAKRLQKDFLVDVDGVYLKYSGDLSLDGTKLSFLKSLGVDVVISNSLEGIPYAIELANGLGVSFAHISLNPLGAGGQIFGVLKPDMKYTVILCKDETKEEIAKIMQALDDLGLKFCPSFNAPSRHHETFIEERFAKNALLISDVSLTENYIKEEVWVASKAGINLEHYFSIYSQENVLPEKSSSDWLLEYSVLMDIAKDSYLIGPNTKGMFKRIMAILRKDAKKYFIEK